MIGNYTLRGSIQLPDDASGLFGTDIVAAGLNPEAALTLTRGSTVAGVAAQPYYLGLLGLRPSAVNITLWYQAFDLQVAQPIAENGTNYFPLRCSSDPSKYVLGRAFLQETYLLVDYEMSNFALSQAQFSKGSDIVSVDHAIAHQASESDAESSGSSSLSRGATAGIAIGAFVALAPFLLLFYLFRRLRHRRQTDIRTRAFIAGPLPLGSTKNSYFNRSTSSGDQNTNPLMTVVSNESSFQRLEERLEWLERAITATE